MAKATAVEDMRSVDPVAYIRATGLRPEDSYGFLPIELNSGSSFFFFYRDRPEYEKARPALPGAEQVSAFGGLAEFGGVGGGAESSMEISDMGKLGEGLGGLVEEAQKAQQAWGAQGVPGAGGPGEEKQRLETIEKMKEMGAINEAEAKQLRSEVQGGEAGPSPGGAPAAQGRQGRAPDRRPPRLPGHAHALLHPPAQPLHPRLPGRAEALLRGRLRRLPRGTRAPATAARTRARPPSGTTSGSSTATATSTRPAGRPGPRR